MPLPNRPIPTPTEQATTRPATYQCVYCQRRHAGQPAYRQPGHDNRPWCQPCADAHFPTCFRCNVRAYGGDMRTIRHSDGMDTNTPQRRCCQGCLVQIRGEYFTGQFKDFDSYNSFGSSRYFGVELETNLGRCSNRYAFAAKNDGSISGWEFVSHKLRGDAGLVELREFMDSGDCIEVGDNCGLHVHMDMSDLSDTQIRAVYAAYVVTEDYWFNKVRSSRQENQYCYRLPERIFEDIRANSYFFDFAEMQDRYAWINAGAYCRHRTLENRLHHATWNYAEVEAWVILNLRFVEACKNLNFARSDSWDSYADKVRVCLTWAESGKGIEALYPPTTGIELAA